MTNTLASPLGKVALCLASLILAGCATSPKVHTQPKAGADFSRYKTFALLPLPKQGPASDPGLVLRLAEGARSTVVESMTARGLNEAGLAEADLGVNLRGQSLPRVEVTDEGFHYPAYTRYGRVDVVRNPGTSVRTYEERTLIVEIFDNHSKDLVWAGWIKREAQGEIQVEKVKEGIRRILEEFPPKAPAQ